MHGTNVRMRKHTSFVVSKWRAVRCKNLTLSIIKTPAVWYLPRGILWNPNYCLIHINITACKTEPTISQSLSLRTFLPYQNSIFICCLTHPCCMSKHTGCPRRNVPDFGRVFLMLKYTDITQNTYAQSWTVMEITARKNFGLLAGPRTVPVSWQSYPCPFLSVVS